MFSEVFRIKPVIDPATAAVAENNLSTRFQKVSKRFSVGLRQVMKGAILGISLALLNKVLNPLNELEEKFRKLIGQGDDIADLAEKYNTDSGSLKRLQDAGSALGLDNDKLTEMMDKFAQAIEDATKPLKLGEERSDAGKAVSNFTDQKDLAEGFFSFVQSLKKSEQRDKVENAVFGGKLYGAQKRVVDADYPEVFKKLNSPTSASLTATISKAQGMNRESDFARTKNETADFQSFISKATPEMVAAMEKSDKKRRDMETAQLKSFLDLQNTAQSIAEVKNLLVETNTVAAKIAGSLGNGVSYIKNFFKPPSFPGVKTRKD